MIMLDGTSMSSLYAYSETVRRLWLRYPENWDTIYEGDKRVRAIEMEKKRRELEKTSGFRKTNAGSPWDAVVAAVAKDRQLWSELVTDVVLLKRTENTRSYGGGKGNARTAPEAKGQKGDGKSKRRREWGTERSGRTLTGQQVCFAFNKAGGCSNPCQTKRAHQCLSCGSKDHGKTNCHRGPRAQPTA